MRRSSSQNRVLTFFPEGGSLWTIASRRLPLVPRQAWNVLSLMPRPNEVPSQASGGDREALAATSREAHACTETARWHVAGFVYGGQMQKGYLSIYSDRLQD